MKTQRAVVGRGGLKTVLFFTFLISSIFCQAVLVPNDSNSLNPNMATMAAMENSQSLRFDPNLYSFLVYDTQGSENSIASAMQKLGISYDLRTAGNSVTLADLQSHDILIVGWRISGGDTSGLDPNILFNGITGRVLLSGHDADYHTAANLEAAETFLSQAIEYVLAGSGTGMITLGDGVTPPFPYLPDEWGVSRTVDGSQTVSSFTDEGLASGVYDNLVPGDMCNWGTSYHDIFTVTGNGFVSFELGGSSGTDIITVAAPINPMGFDLKKYDDVADGDCRNINDGVEYTIEWHNTTDQTFYDAYIKDIFPAGVTYPVDYTFDPNTWEFISLDPGYDEETHTYIYPIGTLDPDDSGILELDVVVNSLAEPGVYLHNVAELWATIYDPNGQNPVEVLIATAFENTLACCWDTSGILYVDQNATGSNTGVSWENAYTELQDALTRARETHCTFDYVIYCAQGVYSPQDTENGFVLPEGVSLYGGFPTGGCDFAYRNPKKYDTNLTGLIDEDEFPDADVIVSMGNNTLLSGFTVTKALTSAISGEGVDFAIEHCVVKDNFQLGINAVNGNVSVQWCKLSGNGSTGLYHSGVGFTLSVDNSHIMRNGEFGINCVESTPTIRNSIVSESDMMEQGRQGVRLYRPTHPPKIFNATIANNKAQGIYFEDNANASGDPNNLDYPDLQNSIVYYNNVAGPQMTGINPDLHANFCCIQDCNEPDTTNFNDEPGFAYAVDPNGAPDPNNYHLAFDAFCKDKANPFLSYTNQVDIDGEGLDRQYGSAVDIGADEVYDCYDDYLSQADVYNACDFDADGIVNMNEFKLFSKAWLSHDPNDPAWLANPNLRDPNLSEGWYEWKYKLNLATAAGSAYTIDTADLTAFLDNWLWIACWKLEEINASMMAMQSQSQSQSMMTESMIVENTEAMMVFPDENSGVVAIESSEVDGQITIQETPEKSIAEQIADLRDSIAFLEQIWNQEPDIQQEINSDEWQEFMDSVKNSLLELQTETIQIE